MVDMEGEVIIEEDGLLLQAERERLRELMIRTREA